MLRHGGLRLCQHHAEDAKGGGAGGLLAATKLLLQTTASEVANLAQQPVRAGKAVLWGGGDSGDEPEPEPPSPRTVSRGVRTNLARPLQVRFDLGLQASGAIAPFWWHCM